MATHDCQLLILFIAVDLNAFVKTQFNNMMMPYQQPVNFLRRNVTVEESNTVNAVPRFPPAIESPQYSYPMLLSVPYAPLYAPGFSYFEPVVHGHPPVSHLFKYINQDKKNIGVNLSDDSYSSDSDSQEQYVDDGKKRIDRRMMIIKNKGGYGIVNPDKYPKKFKHVVSYFDNLISKFNTIVKKKT